jgi:uncharacterized repeat protein (TIGR03803 family)
MKIQIKTYLNIIRALITPLAAVFVDGSVCGQETLYNFPYNYNFSYVYGGVGGGDTLIQSANGDFYGMTSAGGNNGLGSVFKMTSNGTLTTLVSFSATNGGVPLSGLAQASDGNFYGTTYYGGNLSLNNGGGLGTVFRMTAAGILTKLVQFNANNGGFPYAGLTLGNDGNFYGTTFWGGNLALNGGSGYGTVFKMTPAGLLTTLVQFNQHNGANPGVPLVQGSDGNFYGTTYAGGGNDLGTIFKMTPDGTLTPLISFFASNGGHPTARLIQGSDGNFYGTTYSGGNLALNGGSGYGTIFKMTPDGTLTTLVQFNGNNGGHPNAGVVQGSDGNFYGTTAGGTDLAVSSGNSYGTVFKMTPSGVLTTLISFTINNGAYPYGGIIQANDGNFYGTTSAGGSEGGGTVFRFDASSQLGFAQQPGDCSVSLGANALFQSIALGEAPLAYQWYFNEKPILNATNLNLTVANVQLTNGGSYTVVVTNFSGSITSRVATLQVDQTFTKITTGDMVTNVGYGVSCAWGDYDNDGFIDLVVTMGSETSPVPQGNVLFHNNRDGTFTKITNTAVSLEGRDWRGCSWVDYNNDGNLDLFVTSTDQNGFPAQNELFRNNGDGTFTKMTPSNVGSVVALAAGGSEGPVWADYDRDGFVDLYVARYGPDWIFHNKGDGTFVQVSNNTDGILQDDRDSYNAMWSDYDNDGWPDLFVAVNTDNDLNQTNFLYRNQENGTFTRVIKGSITTDNEYSIGCAWGDYDNDGCPDLFVCNGLNHHGINSLYHNNGDGTFTKMTSDVVGSIVSDVANFTQCAWGDYDNDGYLDLLVTSINPLAVNQLYHNNGDGTFTRIMTGSLVNEVGLFFGCAWGDYDNDGFLDIFTAGGMNGLYRNNGNSNGWLKVKLVGTVSNRSAIGAKVRVHATIGGKTFWQLREINTGDGFCAGPLEADFGLGDATNADTVRIEWPSGFVQEFQNVAAKQILTITEPPRLLAATTNGVPQFSIKGGRGLQYDIQASADLAAWSSIGTLTITNLNGMASIVDTNPPTLNQRFYRAIAK